MAPAIIAVMSAPERLERFLKWKGWTQRQAGEYLHSSQSMVSDLCVGRRRPGLSIAHAIERATADWDEGPIRTEEWDEEASTLGPTGTEG